MRLSAGRSGVEVDDAVDALAAGRCLALEAFQGRGEAPALRLRRVRPFAEGRPLGVEGGYVVDRDEVRVWLHPVVWGEGIRSFHGGELPLRLRLITTSPYDSGVVRVSYAPMAD